MLPVSKAGDANTSRCLPAGGEHGRVIAFGQNAGFKSKNSGKIQ